MPRTTTDSGQRREKFREKHTSYVVVRDIERHTRACGGSPVASARWFSISLHLEAYR